MGLDPVKHVIRNFGLKYAIYDAHCVDLMEIKAHPGVFPSQKINHKTQN